MNTSNAINLTLGLAGPAQISGLLLTTRWGCRGRVVVSVLTNALGGVPAASDSLTAFAGPILPVVFLILLVPRRDSYFLLYPAHE
jgi:hypothetical protein